MTHFRRDDLQGGPRSPLCVLIVDDEPSICKVLDIVLAREGYRTFVALSGESAVEILNANLIDVLLVDLRVPDMRGDSIFEYAAALQPKLRSQTLFMTGDLTDAAYRLIAACKCNFLRKPFDLRDLVDAVRALSPSADRSAQADAG